MQRDFATTAAQMDIPQVGAASKKIRDEELKRIENKRIAEKNVTFTQDYNKKQGPDYGSEQWPRGQDFQGRNPNYNFDGRTGRFPTSYQTFSPGRNFADGNNQLNKGRSYDQHPNQPFNRSDENRSRNGIFNHQNGTWRNKRNLFRSPSTHRKDFSQNISYRQPGSDQWNNFAFRRPDNQPPTGLTPYEQIFPKYNNQKSPNKVRFTTTDETNNNLLDLCPLNY